MGRQSAAAAGAHGQRASSVHLRWTAMGMAKQTAFHRLPNITTLESVIEKPRNGQHHNERVQHASKQLHTA